MPRARGGRRSSTTLPITSTWTARPSTDWKPGRRTGPMSLSSLLRRTTHGSTDASSRRWCARGAVILLKALPSLSPAIPKLTVD
eukprot:6494914-Alexandrium_andersonii.AAC.1